MCLESTMSCIRAHRPGTNQQDIEITTPHKDDGHFCRTIQGFVYVAIDRMAMIEVPHLTTEMKVSLIVSHDNSHQGACSFGFVDNYDIITAYSLLT